MIGAARWAAPPRRAGGLGFPWITAAAAVVAGAYVVDVWGRDRIAAVRARAAADRRGKPLINVGCGTAGSCATGAKLHGDVNCDASAPADAPCGPTTICHCDARDLSRWPDKTFGAALASNVLLYLPPADRDRAMAELHRIADEVVVSEQALPWPQLGPGSRFPVSSASPK